MPSNIGRKHYSNYVTVRTIPISEKIVFLRYLIFSILNYEDVSATSRFNRYQVFSYVYVRATFNIVTILQLRPAFPIRDLDAVMT